MTESSSEDVDASVSGNLLTCPSCGHRFDPAGLSHHRRQETGLAPAVFRREGEYWFIAYEDHAFRLRHTIGLGYLASLIASPGREILALHLVQETQGCPIPPPGPRRLGTDDGLRVFIPGDTGAILDARARTAYERRIRELQEDLDEAAAMGDAGRTPWIREELDTLTEHLASALGLGGKPRTGPSPAELARQSVTKAIKSAAERIARHNSALGRHLASTVRTGTYCIYDPDPRIPIVWRL